MTEHATNIILLNSLLIWGIYFAAQEGKLLAPIKNIAIRKVGGFWAKPVFVCPTCMSSFWGVIPFLLGVAVLVVKNGIESLWWLIALPSYIICLAGLNGCIEYLILVCRSIIELKKMLVDEGLLEEILENKNK